MKPVKDYIRTIPDFPKPGIMFRDVTTLFEDPRGFRMAIDQLLHPYAGIQIDKVAGLEARGFILGGAIAHQMSVGFVPIRKKGKLPGKTLEQSYQLEYGDATMEIHDDAFRPGERVLLVDDLLATGGTAEAGIKLIERLGAAIVGCAFIIDLPELGGNEKLLPLGHIPSFIERADAALAKLGPFRINCFGHVGDGNLHYNVFPPKGRSRDDFANLRPDIKSLVHDLTHELEGSVSAEHGVGRLKVADLVKYSDSTKLKTLRAIKSAIDPKGIMNPGALIPEV